MAMPYASRNRPEAMKKKQNVHHNSAAATLKNEFDAKQLIDDTTCELIKHIVGQSKY